MTEKEVQQYSSEDWQLISEAASKFEYPQHDIEAKWNKFNSMISAETKKPELKVIHKSSVNWKSWAVAAMVFMALGLGFYLTKNQTINPQQALVYNTQENIKNITLEDGTKITLNKNSTLTVLILNEMEREVSLIGEGVFKVTHNGYPFRVKANDKVINVLGTVFNVKNIKDMPFSVSLKEGKISLEHQNEEVIMTPGQSIKIINDKIVNNSVETINPLAWTTNKLEYNQVSFETITNELADFYQVKYNFSEELKNTKLTITFDNLTAEESAELLSKVTGVKVSVKRP